ARPPAPTPFPYTTLSRSRGWGSGGGGGARQRGLADQRETAASLRHLEVRGEPRRAYRRRRRQQPVDHLAGRPQRRPPTACRVRRSEEHTSELQSLTNLVC